MNSFFNNTDDSYIILGGICIFCLYNLFIIIILIGVKNNILYHYANQNKLILKQVEFISNDIKTSISKLEIFNTEIKELINELNLTSYECKDNIIIKIKKNKKLLNQLIKLLLKRYYQNKYEENLSDIEYDSYESYNPILDELSTEVHNLKKKKDNNIFNNKNIEIEEKEILTDIKLENIE